MTKIRADPFLNEELHLKLEAQWRHKYTCTESHTGTQNACTYMDITKNDWRRPVAMPEAIRSPQSNLKVSYLPGEGARWHTQAKSVVYKCGRQLQDPCGCVYQKWGQDNCFRLLSPTCKSEMWCSGPIQSQMDSAGGPGDVQSIGNEAKWLLTCAKESKMWNSPVGVERWLPDVMDSFSSHKYALRHTGM